MKLTKDFTLFEINFKELLDSNRLSLKHDINDKFIKPYGFIEDHTNIHKYKIETLYDTERPLSEWILILNNIVTFLENNKISWIPGKCPFIDGNKCGFLILKKTYLIVVTINENGSTNTREYPLTSLAKLT